MDRGACWATVHGIAESDTTEQLSHTHTHTQDTSQGNRNHPSDCLDADKGTERFTGSPQVMDESQLASHMVAWVEGGDGTGGVSGRVF